MMAPTDNDASLTIRKIILSALALNFPEIIKDKDHSPRFSSLFARSSISSATG